MRTGLRPGSTGYHRSQLPEILDRFGVSLRHRGPDGTGRYVNEDASTGLLSQRLAMMDLSGGAQPIANEDRTIHCVFNGEIYNHAELRAALQSRGHAFRTSTDTEVIVHAYEEYGAACVDRLVGMFAFAIWNETERQLFIARDRFGIKPLYYLWEDGILAFASEIKALCRLPWYQPSMNPAALVDYAAFQYTLGDHTFFDRIMRLMPGHSMTLDTHAGLRIRRYWSLDYSDELIDHSRTEGDFGEELRSLLARSVAQHCQGDVPVGAHLSGGLDSSLVAVLASAHMPSRLHTFTAGFRDAAEYDETAYARSVADAIGSLHHEVFPRPQQFIETLPRLIYHMDEPAAGPGLFPQFLISQLASEHVKAVLSGLGGDEIAGGYVRYYAAMLESGLRDAIAGNHSSATPLDGLTRHVDQLSGYRELLQNLWSDGLFGPDVERYYRLVRRSEPRRLLSGDVLQAADRDPFDAFAAAFNVPRTSSYLNRMLFFDAQGMLPSLLQVEDRVSMAVSIESRVPLLDHRLAEFMATIPSEMKMKDGRLRSLYRTAVGTIVPPHIAARTNKMGLPVPLTPWLRGPLVEFVNDVLFSWQTSERGLFDPAAMKRLREAPLGVGREIWGLLCIELWCREFLDGRRTTWNE